MSRLRLPPASAEQSERRRERKTAAAGASAGAGNPLPRPTPNPQVTLVAPWRAYQSYLIEYLSAPSSVAPMGNGAAYSDRDSMAAFTSSEAARGALRFTLRPSGETARVEMERAKRRYARYVRNQSLREGGFQRREKEL